NFFICDNFVITRLNANLSTHSHKHIFDMVKTIHSMDTYFPRQFRRFLQRFRSYFAQIKIVLMWNTSFRRQSEIIFSFGNLAALGLQLSTTPMNTIP
ncbi:Hypothetical predicted protein, partial [Paramuricea clavata]